MLNINLKIVGFKMKNKQLVKFNRGIAEYTGNGSESRKEFKIIQYFAGCESEHKLLWFFEKDYKLIDNLKNGEVLTEKVKFSDLKNNEYCVKDKRCLKFVYSKKKIVEIISNYKQLKPEFKFQEHVYKIVNYKHKIKI